MSAAPAGRRYATVLVDDVQSLRKLIRFAIESSGRFEVVSEAGSGTEAIQKVRVAQPDLVLLDLSMPKMDGLEALPHVLQAAPHAQVVVLSGFEEARMGPVAKRLGAAAYLEKGAEPGAMVESLLAVMERNHDGRGARETPRRTDPPGPGRPRFPVRDPPLSAT
ncbi:MAG: response regulator, partial [Methanobacteriota archaeon]